MRPKTLLAVGASAVVLTFCVSVVTSVPGSAQSNKTIVPLLVRDVDNPARQPWACAQRLIVPANEVGARPRFTCPAVPAGKRLVVEQVSWLSEESVPDGERLILGVTTHTAGQSEAFFSLPGQQAGGDTRLVHFYVEPGFTLKLMSGLSFYRNGIYLTDVTVSGYLVDIN